MPNCSQRQAAATTVWAAAASSCRAARLLPTRFGCSAAEDVAPQPARAASDSNSSAVTGWGDAVMRRRRGLRGEVRCFSVLAW